MAISGTISSYLESEKKFDHLFWTSYTMDPITVEFLFKNDLSSCLNRPYFHLICDKNRIDEAIDSCLPHPKRINRLLQMQNYVLLSHERVEGAFHPKILFFSGTDAIKCIILSGNATSSGILSNQDLVAKFEWSASGSDDARNELASIYQFLRSFGGWKPESRSELDSIAGTHPWLLELQSNRVFFSNGNASLLDQLDTTFLFDWSVERILIFSPFVDPDLRALTEIAVRFPSSEIVLYYPGDFVEVKNSSMALPSKLAIRSSDCLSKSRFHAKYFAFLGSDKAYVLWGSANCSFSALLSPNRNREILIGYECDPAEINDLWPGSLSSENSSALPLRQADVKSTAESLAIELLDGRIEGDSIELIANCELNKLYLRIILLNGEEESSERILSSGLSLTLAVENAQKVCAVYVYDENGKRLSNALFLNNFQKIQRIIDGADQAPDYDRLKDKQSELVKRLGSEFFVLDKDKSITNRRSHRSDQSQAFAFWHMPQYTKSAGFSGIFGHERFMHGYVGGHKSRRDTDDDRDGEKKKKHSTERNSTKQFRTSFLELKDQATKVLAALKLCVKDKNREAKIPLDRWLKGEDYMIRYMLESIDDREILLDRELAQIRSFLRDFLRIVHYTLSKLKIDEYEEGKAFIKSLNMMSSLYLLLAKYAWSKMAYEHGTLSTTTGFDENLQCLADACFLKTLSELVLDRFSVSRLYEAKSMLLEHVSSCLRHAHAANEALVFASPGLIHVDEPEFEQFDVVKINGSYFLFDGRKSSNQLQFTNLLGDTRTFLAEYIAPRRVYQFENAIW